MTAESRQTPTLYLHPVAALTITDHGSRLVEAAEQNGCCGLLVGHCSAQCDVEVLNCLPMQQLEIFCWEKVYDAYNNFVDVRSDQNRIFGYYTRQSEITECMCGADCKWKKLLMAGHIERPHLVLLKDSPATANDLPFLAYRQVNGEIVPMNVSLVSDNVEAICCRYLARCTFKAKSSSIETSLNSTASLMECLHVLLNYLNLVANDPSKADYQIIRAMNKLRSDRLIISEKLAGATNAFEQEGITRHIHHLSRLTQAVCNTYFLKTASDKDDTEKKSSSAVTEEMLTESD